jgi:hypothetical protein
MSKWAVVLRYQHSGSFSVEKTFTSLDWAAIWCARWQWNHDPGKPLGPCDFCVVEVTA